MKLKFFTLARFCPWCSTETITRDDWRKDHGGKNGKDGRSTFDAGAPVEYVCSLCGVGFQIQASARYQFAKRMAAEDRKIRTHAQ